MKPFTKLLFLQCLLFVALVAPSCEEQRLEPAPPAPGTVAIEASFTPMSQYVPGERDSLPATKAAPGGVASSFRGWGYLWPTASSQGAPTWFVDETFSQDGTLWVSSSIHAAIPSGYSARLWGIAPAGASGLSSLPAAGVSATPSFSYTVPSAVASQSDLQVAYSSVATSAAASMTMTFEHVLAGIRFSTGTAYVPPCTIRTISVSAVKGMGTYTQGSGWSSVSGSNTYTISPEQAVSRTDFGVQVGTDAMTMMVIPQTLAAGSTLSVTVNRGSGNETFTADLGGVELRQGYVTTIRLNLPAEDAIDLSYRTYTGAVSASRNTANCYVVKDGGMYEIPMVYGNAIKAGTTNSAAYTRQGSTYTADFVNHLGNTLTSPYIESNSGCTAASAELLWQTHTGMITSVTIVPGSPCRKVRVQVNSVPATNGLAVIAVKDTFGDIMWSWTLWMTSDALAPEATTNHDAVTYYLLNESLGAIWNGASRSVAGGARYTNPHYQWGRKDPMPPAAAYNSSSIAALYTISGGSYSGYGVYGVADDGDESGTLRSVANAIKMPDKFFNYYNSSYYNWNNLAYFNNYWNTAMTVTASLADDQASAVKTIYDPCPAGWMIPGPKAWTGFTTTGSNTSTSSEWNVIGSFTNGWTFKRSDGDGTGTYYAASGYRNCSGGGLYGVGSNGYFWSYAPGSATYARYLRFYSGSVNPLADNFRAYGFSVRPAQEP